MTTSTPCLRAVRTLLESCLDAHADEGERFRAADWLDLIGAINIPSVQRDAKIAADSDMDYIAGMHDKVVALLGEVDAEPSQAVRDAERQRFDAMKAQKLADMSAAEKEREDKRKAKSAARRQAADDLKWFDRNPLWAHEAACADPCCVADARQMQGRGD